MAAEFIDIYEAFSIIEDVVDRLDDSSVFVTDALHHTLSQDIISKSDAPAFDRSMMDGFAVRSDDVKNPPVELQIIDHIPADHVSSKTLESGQASQINTGAQIPAGADCVIRIEDTKSDESSSQVSIQVSSESGKFIIKKGTYHKVGKVAVPTGTRITPIETAVAISNGESNLIVIRQPQIGIITTGDEIVSPGETLSGSKIYNTNSFMLDALFSSLQFSIVSNEHASDNLEDLTQKIKKASQTDILCLTGGVSMGTLDLVPAALELNNATIHIRKMAIKPGKPVIFATLPSGTKVFALPGNPISAFNGFHLLVRHALSIMQNCDSIRAPWKSATFKGTMGPNQKRRAFLPVSLEINEQGKLVASPLSWKGSGDLFGMVHANGMIMREPDAGPIESGDSVTVVQINDQLVSTWKTS